MTARYIIGLFFIVLGLSVLTGFDVGQFIGPVILIAIGWIILTGRSRRFDKDNLRETEQDFLDEVFVFSGTQKSIKSDKFAGGKVVTIFGGAELDLADVKSKEKNINMELVSVFGGIRMRVPENWHVTSEAVGIIGGVDNKTKVNKQKSTELHVNGAAVFGGIEIFN